MALRGLSKKQPSTIGEAIDEPLWDFGGEEFGSKQASPTAISLFQHPDAHPIVLDLALLRQYGPEWLTWEPEVLVWRIPQDFRTASVSDLNVEKIQAVKTLHFTDDPWKEWQIFLWTCLAVNGVFPDFEVMQVPTAAQTMVAISIFNKVRRDVPWSDEVKDYLGVVWKNDGILCTIEPADFFTIDVEGLVVDCEKVEQRWPQVRRDRQAPFGQTVEDEQLRRLLMIHEYLQEDITLLEQQMPLVLRS